MQHPHALPDVLVAHPLPLLAAGLCNALAPAAAMWSDPAQGRLPHDPAHSVLVTDLHMALEVLAQDRPQPGSPWRPWRCVVVSLEAGCCLVRHALQQGVLGFLQAGCSMEELHHAVAAARSGQRFLCSATAARMAEAAVDEPLTPREDQVLLLLCQGLDNKSIALRLDMALGTVKTHVKAILEKLGASSRTQAVAAAHRRGMTAVAHHRPGASTSGRVAASQGVRPPMRRPVVAAPPPAAQHLAQQPPHHAARKVPPPLPAASAEPLLASSR